MAGRCNTSSDNCVDNGGNQLTPVLALLQNDPAFCFFFFFLSLFSDTSGTRTDTQHQMNESRIAMGFATRNVTFTSKTKSRLMVKNKKPKKELKKKTNRKRAKEREELMPLENFWNVCMFEWVQNWCTFAFIYNCDFQEAFQMPIHRTFIQKILQKINSLMNCIDDNKLLTPSILHKQ